MYNDFDEFLKREDNEIDDEDELCYECSLYDDNSYLDENGEWVNCCLECPLIAIFKIKAHIRRSGTSRNNQRQSQSEKHSESHLEEHPASSP